MKAGALQSDRTAKTWIDLGNLLSNLFPKGEQSLSFCIQRLKVCGFGYWEQSIS